MQGIHLVCIAIELFPDTINKELCYTTDIDVDTKDRVILFFVCIAIDDRTRWVVREKAVLTAMKLLASCDSCLCLCVQVSHLHCTRFIFMPYISPH